MSTEDDPLLRALTMLADVDRSRRAGPQVERALLDAFDRETHRGRSRWSGDRLQQFTAVAAIATLTIGVAAIMTLNIALGVNRLARDRDSTPPALSDRPTPLSPAERVRERSVQGNAPAEPQAASSKTARMHSRRHAATKMRRSAVTASDGIVAANREAGHVARLVRVRLPRAALPSLGIPILEPDAPGMLEVEVIIGEDGLPRIVRMAR